jgi:hypothetical protein
MISQSLMKDLQKYFLKKECGLVLKAKYIENKNFGSSEAMLLGQYFEYMATGQLPKFGNVPKPKVVYEGKPNEKLSEPYQRAFASSNFCKVILEKLGLEIISTGERLEHNDANGTLDLLVRWDGRLCIIDLKYSGLLDNRWDERGWDFDTLHEKESLMIQAVHYKWLAESIYQEPVDFYFFLFSTQNPSDVRIAKVEIDSMKTLKHIEDVKLAKDIWTKMKATDNFKARPTLARCSECALNETCPERALLPTITTIYY